MTEQLELQFGDPLSLSERNKEEGMQAAVNHADAKIERWSDKASKMLGQFILFRHEEFLAEDVRNWATLNGLPHPPNERAWGAVIRRASIAGIIKFAGYAKTVNPKSHRTPAALWESTKTR